MQPYNYTIQAPNPFESALGGLKLGFGLQDMQAQRQAQELKLQQEQQGMLRQQELQSRMQSLMNNPNPMAKDYTDLAMLLPEKEANSIRANWETLSKDRQSKDLQSAGQIMAAFQSGAPGIGLKMLRERAEAANNSGDTEQAKALETWAKIAELNPSAVTKSIGSFVALLPGGDKVIESVTKLGSESRAEAEASSDLRKKIANADEAVATAKTAQATATNADEKARADAAKATADAEKAAIDAKYAEKIVLADLKKKAADLGLTSAQTGTALAQTRKLNNEIAKSVLELEAIKANGGGDPTKNFDYEEKIRKEWQGRKKTYRELQGTFSTLKSSAESSNGPGDIALITGFMKMLDPGSVVRETEFATARDTAGLFTQLQNRLSKAESGQLLSPAQRKEYVALSQKYLDAAQAKAGEEKKALGVVVKNYKLNPENVFGPEQITGGGGRGSVNPPVIGQPTATVAGQTYARPANFTDAQWAAYKQSTGAK